MAKVKVYPHEKLLEESEVKKSELPSEIQSEIKVFNMQKGRGRAEKQNDFHSLQIANSMYAWMLDEKLIKEGEVEKPNTDAAASTTTTDSDTSSDNSDKPKDQQPDVTGQNNGNQDKPAEQQTNASTSAATGSTTDAPPVDKNVNQSATQDGSQQKPADNQAAAATATTDSAATDKKPDAQTPPAKKKRFVPLLGWIETN